MSEGRLKKTPLHEVHLTLGARMVPFAGFHMPLQYRRSLDEHRHVREAVGVFDVSHMGEIVLRGPGAPQAIQRLVTNDVLKPKPGRAVYTPACLPTGGIVDDMIVYRIAEEVFFVCVNAANTEKDYQWFRDNAESSVCTVEDESSRWAQLAVQGPRAPELLDRLLGVSVSGMKPFRCLVLGHGGYQLLFATTGYTGEKGGEIYCPADKALDLWEELTNLGKDFDLWPIGLAARDTLRLEMRYCLYGNDITEDTTPLEAGLEWTVKFQKGDFIGRDALLRQKEKGVERRLVGFVLTQKGVPRHGQTILREDVRVGEVTSGALSPMLNRGIGLGYVSVGCAETGNYLTIAVQGGRKLGAEVVDGPFYRRVG